MLTIIQLSRSRCMWPFFWHFSTWHVVVIHRGHSTVLTGRLVDVILNVVVIFLTDIVIAIRVHGAAGCQGLHDIVTVVGRIHANIHDDNGGRAGPAASLSSLFQCNHTITLAITALLMLCSKIRVGFRIHGLLDRSHAPSLHVQSLVNWIIICKIKDQLDELQNESWSNPNKNAFLYKSSYL